MTSTIKVNKHQNACGTNIIQRCGTTTTIGSGASNTLVMDGSAVTIGRCGGTVALASGASQTGFGRTGTVDWQTTIKTGDFTATSGEGYFINKTSGTVTMTLPASPSAGDIVAFKDYANTFDSNELIIARNGSLIGGTAADGVIEVEGQALTLVYGDATKGWQGVYAATEADLPKPSFVTATGGTITTVGNDKIHTFTSPGTFAISQISGVAANNQLSYLVVAGGGGAGGGGGGGGGFRENKSPVNPYTASPLEGSPDIAATIASFPITVGAGGAKKPTVPYPGSGNNGSPSIFSTITSAGGGGGAAYTYCSPNAPTSNPGGSGGGGTYDFPGGIVSSTPYPAYKGDGNSPPVSPPQGQPGGGGNNSWTTSVSGGGGGGATDAGTVGATQQGGPGGDGATTSINGTPTTRAGGGGGGGQQPGTNGGTGIGGTGCSAGGGGGGATAAGTNASPGSPGTSGNGGAGATTNITGSPVAYAGGGGGGGDNRSPGVAGGTGGAGGGGAGGAGTSTPGGTAGTTNRGSGGGGAGFGLPLSPNYAVGAAGGSGIVVIRYKFQ